MADQVETAQSAERQPGPLKIRFAALTGITLTAAAVHALPHPMSFTPLFAMALFGGAYFRSRIAAFVVPIASLFLGDLALGYLVYGRQVFWLMPFDYFCFVLTVLLGIWVRRRRQAPVAIAGAALMSALAFYLISNFGFWLVFGKPTYAGFVEVYVAGIDPSLRNMLLSDALYTVVLFGGFALAQRSIAPLREPAPLATPH